MKVTISVIKADIGSIGGHIRPSTRLMETVDAYVTEHGVKLFLDSYISYTGDDIAIVSTHERGPNDEGIHKLCWDAFMAGTEVAKSQGLYGAGQDLLKDAFAGNVRGMGPAVAEIVFEERPNDPSCFSPRIKPTPAPITCPCTWLLPTP